MKALRVRDVAKRLDCSVDQVRALIAADKLQAVNVGNGTKRAAWRISEQALEAFLTHTAR